MLKDRTVAGNTTTTQPENRAFFPALDGLRAVAFLMVFLWHYLTFPWGWAGVDMFFVISGFLITGILFDTQNDPHRARNFYARRTLRIFPLYYGVLLVVVLVGLAIHWQYPAGDWILWFSYFGNFAGTVHPYTAGAPAHLVSSFELHSLAAIHGKHVELHLGHFWSLCVEEQFYLFWPWVVFWIRDRRKLMWICAAAIPADIALRWLSRFHLTAWAGTTPFRVDGLLLGGLLALLMRGNPQTWQQLQTLARWLLIPVFSSVLVWVFLIPSHFGLAAGYPYPSWIDTYGLTGVELLAALLLINVLQPATWVFRLFNLKWLRWAGRISYGTYVVHDIFHAQYNTVAHALAPKHFAYVGAALALISTYVLAALLFRFLESPFLRLKEHWTIRA